MTLPAVIPTTVPSEGPCQPWTTVADVRTRCNLPAPPTPGALTDEALDFGIELASLILWAESGRRYGLCQRTFRPCSASGYDHSFRVSTQWPSPTAYPPNSQSLSWGPVDVFNSWPRLGGCGCSLPELVLPGPIAWVDQIMYDGVALDLNQVRIKLSDPNPRRALVRVDGESWWCCNDLDADPTVVPVNPRSCPAWQVTYWVGRQVPTSAVVAVSKLAEQFARQFCDDSGCDANMNQNLRRVARRGIVKEYDPALLTDDEGRRATGISVADEWVRAVNPHGRKRAPVVVRADDPEPRRIWDLIPAA